MNNKRMVKITTMVNGQPVTKYMTYDEYLRSEYYQPNKLGAGSGSLFDSFFGDSYMGGSTGFDGLNSQTGACDPRIPGSCETGAAGASRASEGGEQVNIADFFSSRANSVVEKSLEIALEHNSKRVDTEHMLLAILDSKDPVVNKVLENLKISEHDLSEYTRQNIQDLGQKVSERETPELSPRLKSVLLKAYEEAKGAGYNYVGPEHILLALIEEKNALSGHILAKFSMDSSKVRKLLSEKLKPNVNGQTQDDSSGKTPNLNKFGQDLTKKAAQGKIDPIIGRTEEINRVITILSRRTKNNPVLIGEPGVGKTAIAEGLALRIQQNNVPQTLKGKRVVALDINSMVAGSKYRGEFEERIKKVVDEIKAVEGEVILFIDELHTIVGAGAQEGQLDAANILKPALARGELQTIGATTLAEYKKYIEKDAALERRFQPVIVDEPNVEEAIQILRGVKDKYEAHHKVDISEEAIIAAVTLSKKYIADRFLPDKAFDLIDEAAAKVHLQMMANPEELKELEDEIKQVRKEEASSVAAEEFEKAAELKKQIEELEAKLEDMQTQSMFKKGRSSAEVSAEDIKDLISEWTGIPANKMEEEEAKKLLDLENRIAKKVIGQKEAIKLISEAIRRGRAGLKDPSRPIGSFLFLGPTGVGKTELTKVVTEEMFGEAENMIRLDMSEYMERHSVAKLIGSPPGYVGFNDGGQLTEKVRRNPYSVILLDEIEKAHPDVFNILLQVLDDGRLTDSKGRTVDFRNTIIVATSNIGFGQEAEMIASMQPDSEKMDMKNRVMKAVKQHFRPEFLNRLDEIVVFESLSKDEVLQILDLLIQDLNKRLMEKGVAVEITNKAKDKLVELGYDKEFGARPMKRTISRLIENKLATGLLQGDYSQGSVVKVGLKSNGEFSFKVK